MGFLISFHFLSFLIRPKRQAKRQASDGNGEVKIEPEEMVFAIMTDKEVYKYKTKEIFEEKLEAIN